VRRTVVFIFLVVLPGACSGEESRTETDGSIAPTGPPGVTEVTGASGPTASTLEERTEVAIELDFPDRILVGFDSIWIHTDDQRELRIDPSTNEVVAEVRLGDGFCQGSGIGEDALWACAENMLVRIDPATDEVDLETGVEMQSGQWAIGVGEGAVWVLESGLGDVLLEVDERSGKVRGRVELGQACVDTAVGSGTVWITCTAGGTVLALDPASRELSEVPVEGVANIAVGPDAVWVGSSAAAGGVARIDPGTLDIGFVPGTAGPGETGAIWVDGTDVWVRSSGVFLTRVDATTLSVVEELPSEQPLGGGAVAAGFGSVWASSYDFFRVLRIAP
jgi:streptogramin lyase